MLGAIEEARSVLVKRGTKQELEHALYNLIAASEKMSKRLDEVAPLVDVIEAVARRVTQDRIENEFGSRL